MTPYLNIHTHYPLFVGEATPTSCGLHPWHVTACWEEQLRSLFTPERIAEIDVIGECGLDLLCEVPIDLQEAAFRHQIALSEELHKPLIIHCVRAIDDIIRLHRGTTQSWIIHGFRGKPQQAEQLTKLGFFLSVPYRPSQEGQPHPSAFLSSCPIEALFLETDDICAPIAPLYRSVALQLGMSVEQLCNQVWENARRAGICK